MPINTDIYGPVISRRDVAQAVITQLQTWMPSALAEVERQEGLTAHTIPVPPDEVNSWKIALDFRTWMQGATPCLIVVAKPSSSVPERMYSNGQYMVEFNIQVCAVIQGDTEDDAIATADYYGSAIRIALLQHGSLGTWQNGDPVATKTTLRGFQDTVFPFADSEKGRRIVQSIVTLTALIPNVITEAAGPSTPPANPYNDPGTWPTVEDVNVTVTPESLSTS